MYRWRALENTTKNACTLPVGGPDDDDVRGPDLPVEAVHESQQLRQGPRPFPAARLVPVPISSGAPPKTTAAPGKQAGQRGTGNEAMFWCRMSTQLQHNNATRSRNGQQK